MKNESTFWKAAWRLAKQSFIPLVISIAYAFFVYINRGDKAHITDAITAFGGSFFFCMWLAGQYFRASKQIADSNNFNQLSTGLDEINASIKQLKQATVVTTTINGTPQSPTGLIEKAKELVQAGHVLAGLLQAGLAFEQAIQAKASRTGLDRGKFRSIPRMLQSIEEQLGPGASNELQTLWKFRNQIVHADPQASDELQLRPELVDYFESGIKMLGQDRDDF